MDSKKVMSAIFIVMFLAGMASAAAASSSAPPTSHLSINVYVGPSGKSIGFATSPLLYINSTNGKFTESIVGATLNESLVQGNYTITVMPTQSIINGNDIITTKSVSYVDVSAKYQTDSICLSYSSEVYSSVDLSGLNGHTVTVSFSTTTHYSFFTKTTNKTSFSAPLPSAGEFYSNIYVAGNPATQVSQLLTLPATHTVTVYLNSTTVSVFGTVYNKTSGSQITSFNLVEYNALSTSKYTVVKYDQATFAASAQNHTLFYVAANGYAPQAVTNTTHVVNLLPSNSYVNTQYSLSANLQSLSVVTHYDIVSGSFPGIANSSVMDLSLQYSLDSNFASLVKQYVSQIPVNTYYTFLANSSYYNLTNSHYSSVAVSSTGVNVYEYSNYTNSKMKASEYSNLVLNVFQKGTKYTPVTIDYTSTILYDNTSASVQSASSSVTYGNPFQILPVSSNSMVQVTFGKAQRPYFVDSNAKTYFKGIVTSSSIVNSTAKNMVVVAPEGQEFSLNMSGTLYNPLVGEYETNAPATFTWMVNGKSYTGSNLTYNSNNLTMKYSGITYLTLTGTDYSGFSNVTHITVIPFNTSSNPSINVTYTVNGKTYNLTSTQTASGTVSISVPQNTAIVFDASGSSLNLTYNGTKYSTSLYYAWSFPNYTAVGSTVNYKFTKPYITAGLQNGYLNVTSAWNSTSHLIFKATVNDTTLPSSVVTIQKDGKNITAIPASTPFVVTANYSSYKYADFNQLSFVWTFEYGNGTAIPFNSTNLTVVASSSSNINESTWIKVQINLVAKIYISLKVTSNNLSAYDNVSYTTTYSGPKLLVTGIYYSGSFSQGVTKEVQVNVTNKGSANVDNETIMVYVGSTLVGSQAYSTVLDVNQSGTFQVNVTLPNSGSQSLSFQAYNKAQPSFVQKDESLTHSVSVGVSSDRVILVVVVIIVIIIILALLYFRVTRGRFTRNPRNSSKSLPTSGKPGQKKIADSKQSPPSKQ